MKYSGSGWNLAVTSDAPGGGTDSASLAVSGGVISSASLTLTNMTFLKTVTINTATISYAASQPNQACNTVTGTEIWCGSWQISFPKATSVSGVSGSLAFQAGQFASGAVSVSGNVALLDGVFLTQLGATLTINPAPTTVAGSATISFGPQVAGVSALSLQGTLTRAFPTAKSGGFYDLQGNLTALAGSSHALLLGSGEVKVEDTGKATVSLTLGGGPGGLSVTVGSATASIAGMLTGTFTSSTFSLTGTTMITVPVLGTFSGSLKADNNGIASCAKVPGGKQVGFEYFWSNGATQVFDTKGCTEAGF
jgi:hypothetical protein